MVAKITFPKMIEAALNYNEAKVQQGKAACLQASNYLREAHEMNFYEKLDGFRRLNELNQRAITKTIHISLNFDPSEKLSDSKLTELANAYMQKIGFGEQPFLVYKHDDAGHPHIHIVSNTIRHDGSRISTHNIGRNQSETARKEIENLFGLMKASGRSEYKAFRIRPLELQKALYGKAETKRSIANVVTAVFNQYKFCSLPEFNAALKQFNVIADRGKEDGRIYKYRGLTYRILDGEGNKVGVPIKASGISVKPTLANVEGRFAENEKSKEALRPIVKTKLDNALRQLPTTFTNLIRKMETQNVHTMLRQNSEGCVYGITFVDNTCKCVFNGSDLGREYSAAALQSQLAANKNCYTQSQGKYLVLPSQKQKLLDILISAKEPWTDAPNGLLKKKRKKKRKPPNS